MTKLVFYTLFFVMVSVFSMSTPTKAQNYELLFQNFNSRDLSYEDRRYLQTALAFEGHYRGLLDGNWGKLSREAMNSYSHSEFGTSSDEWHTAVLAINFFNRYDRAGWDMRYFPDLKMSVMLPEKELIVDEPSEHFRNYRHIASSLSVSMGRHNQKTVSNFHRYTFESHSNSEKPYSVRKTNFAVSSAVQANGARLYTRSHFIDGAWSTVMVSALAEDETTFNAVTSSIALGSTAQLKMSHNSKLIHIVQTALEYSSTAEPDNKRDALKNPPQKKVSKSSGTGFVVSRDGHILTNAHVVDGCSTILVDGENANLLETSSAFDLAILKTKISNDKNVAMFSANPAKLNSDVTAIGFPYADLLGGLNVTRGSVSSLKGFRGDPVTFQISAPVQSGNSGGPLVASDGDVVGVVVSKLDALAIAENGGDLPQNVNFAIRGEIAKLFLAQNQIEPQLSLASELLNPETLAEKAAKFTSFIECY